MKGPTKLRRHLCFLDVGHGNAAVLIAGDQEVALVDVGRHSALREFLDEQQITRIGSIYLSHADQDHIGALVGLLAAPDILIERRLFELGCLEALQGMERPPLRARPSTPSRPAPVPNQSRRRPQGAAYRPSVPRSARPRPLSHRQRSRQHRPRGATNPHEFHQRCPRHLGRRPTPCPPSRRPRRRRPARPAAQRPRSSRTDPRLPAPRRHARRHGPRRLCPGPCFKPSRPAKSSSL